MRAPFLRAALLVASLTLTLAPGADAYEGGKRQEVDGGVHQPVLTKPPELVQFVPAVYPPEAQAQGLTGSVRLLVTLDETGAVSEAIVPEPIGHGFDEAAIAAVRQFRFSPAEVDGVPAPIQLEYVYHFTLEVPDAGAAPPEPPPVATLKGELIARGSRTRVKGATVRCGDAADAPEVTSDEEGRFELKTVPGTCEVRVVANGYQRFQTPEPLEQGETREVVYHLLPTAIGYETVVRDVREKKEVVRRTVERQELQRVPGTFGDPVRVLQNLPGVARAPLISGALIVRGAAPDQTQTLIDGVEVPLLFHLGGGPSILNAEFLDRIDFYPGGFASRFGRAVGGIVDVGTRKGASDTWHGSVKIDFLDSGFFVEAPVRPGISLAAAARRSYIDVLLPAVLPDDPQGGTLLALPRYWDYQVRVDVGPRTQEPGKPRNSFYLMAFGSDDVLQVVSTGGARNRDISLDFHTLFHRLKGDWTYQHGGFTSVFTPYAGYDLQSIAFGPDNRFDADDWTLGGREDLQVELFPALTLRAGADVLFDHFVGELSLEIADFEEYPGAEPEIPPTVYAPTINSFDGAAYLEADVKVGPVVLTPGLRATLSRIRGRYVRTYDPRLWARWSLLPSTAVKGSAGLYSQRPGIFNTSDYPFGNPKLGMERAFQTSVGVEHRFTEAITGDLTLYYNRRYDNVVGSDEPTDDPEQPRELFANRGLGRAYGAEVLVRHDVTEKLFGWLAYTFNRSESTVAGSGEPYTLNAFDQTHILTAVLSYRLPLGFELGGRFRYVTGRPITPVRHDGTDRFFFDRNAYTGVEGAPNSERLPAFNQLDLRLDKTFLFENWSLSAYLDVQNVYNARNIEAVFYDYRYRERVEVPGVPFLPVLGVKGSF